VEVADLQDLPVLADLRELLVLLDNPYQGVSQFNMEEPHSAMLDGFLNKYLIQELI
jgi:hypothetical protein